MSPRPDQPRHEGVLLTLRIERSQDCNGGHGSESLKTNHEEHEDHEVGYRTIRFTPCFNMRVLKLISSPIRIMESFM